MVSPTGTGVGGPSNDRARADRRLLARRLPLFAAAWLGTLPIWLAIYWLEARLVALPAIALVLVQAAILGGALALVSRERDAQRVRGVVIVTATLLGLATTGCLGAMGGPADVLAFALLTLYLVAALVFAWGWQAELIVLGTTIGPALIVLWAQGHVVSIYLMTAAIVIGTVTSLLVAEVSWRNLDAWLARGESEARFRGAFDHAPLGMVIASLDGRLSQVNRAFCVMLGYGERALLEKTIAEITHSDDVGASLDVLRRLVTGEQESFAIEKRYLHRDGHVVLGEVTGSLLRDTSGAPSHYIAQVQNVSERRRREDALRASEARYRGLVESQHDLVARSDPEGRLTFANDAYRKALGLRQEDIERRVITISDVVHPDDLPLVREGLDALTRPPYRVRVENRDRTPAGWRWFEWETSGLRNAEGKTVEFQASGRDITERRESERQLHESLAKLHRSEEKLRALALRQVSIRESERKRLGLDLHDDVCQELVGVGILLESLRRRLGPMAEENAATFDRISRYLDELVEHLRVLARDLQPLQLRDYGLAEALHSLAAGMSSEAVPVETTLPADVPRLDEATEVSVYRFAQEALTNAVRHAAARLIELTVTVEGDVLRLVVTDDGCGFDPEDCPDALGIVSMEERVIALGGRFSLRSAPGEGTAVTMECRLAAPDAPPVSSRAVRSG